MNVGISDIYHKCDKTNIWTEEANERVKNSVVAGQTQFDRFWFSVKYVQGHYIDLNLIKRLTMRLFDKLKLN